MNDQPNREVEVFTEAIQLPASGRAAYLERVCGGDAKLRQKVEALLRTHDRVGDFLEVSPQKTAIGVRPETAAGEKAGDCIGRYKLLQQIGEGGCGVVYMADQQEPVRRRVALKIIKPGMDTKNVIARFEAERQALAMMDHPNIAKVFDAGATNSGRPYFVMELIRGIKITDYCDEYSLTTEERLKLFVQVCQAVQHAHQKGIIHRDIKPSNILVTTTMQGAAMPMVIDFGIAKATTNQQLTDKTLFTAFEMLIGTPAYMSPEQAAITSVDVDTRTDIYSLGVLLYELLTGLTPFDTGELLKSGLDEIRRVIRDQEPLRPSTRLSKMTIADLTTAAVHRKSEPPTLIRVIRGDLDWIAMKALEKDRTRRYETAYGMGRDVERYLANEPVSARPPSKFYKFKMTVVRNKLLFIGLAVIALLLILGLVIVSASLARERQARREADAALRQAKTDEAKAQTEAVRSRQATAFLEDMLRGVGPSVARGRDTIMLREILDRTADRVGKELTNQPSVEAELCSLIGQLYLEIGNYDGAEMTQRRALAINQKLFGPASKEAAASLDELGQALDKEGNLSESENVHRQALAIRKGLYGGQHPEVASSLNDLASVLRHQGKSEDSRVLTQEALDIRRKLFGDDSLAVADTLHNLCVVLGDEGKWVESEATAREELAIKRKLLGLEDPAVALALNDVAWAAGSNGKPDEAESLQREALAMQRKLLGEENPAVAKTLSSLGERLRKRGDLTAAANLIGTAVAIQRRISGENSPEFLYALDNLAVTLEAEGQLGESESAHREALAWWRQREGSAGPRTLAELDGLVGVLVAQKKFKEAGQLLDETLTTELVRQPGSADLLYWRADLETRAGRCPAAAADAVLAFDNQPWLNRYSLVAALLIKTHDSPAYARFCRKLLSLFAGATDIYVADQVAKSCLYGPFEEVDLRVVDQIVDTTLEHGTGDAAALPYFQDSKALSEYRQGHYAEAIEWAEKPLQVPGLSGHGHTYAVLAMAYWQLGQKDEARTMLARGEELQPANMPAAIAEDPSDLWQHWLFARIQLDEAAALIQSGSTINVPSGLSQ